jgi:hypothetical protein
MVGGHLARNKEQIPLAKIIVLQHEILPRIFHTPLGGVADEFMPTRVVTFEIWKF